MNNVESILVDLLNASNEFKTLLGLTAHMDVPKSRPAKFVTVERTGGNRDQFRDLPTVAVQVWADTRYNASQMAGSVATILESFATTEHVHRVDVNSIHNFPDPLSGQARYQIVLSIVTK